MVEVGVGQEDAFDVAPARALIRQEGGEGFDLHADVGRGIEEEPVSIVGADGDARLSPRPRAKSAAADALAIAAAAVPLPGSATPRRSQQAQRAEDEGIRT